MARLESLPEAFRKHLIDLPCPVFGSQPWTGGPPLKNRRIAIVSTAGLHLRGDRPFAAWSGEYRLIPGQAAASDLVMSHVSTNFDRSGFQQDHNVMLPLDRLRELAAQGVIASLASYHYSFMGASDPREMEPAAREVAELLLRDGVGGVLLVPV